MHAEARMFCVLFVLHEAELNNDSHDQSKYKTHILIHSIVYHTSLRREYASTI